MITIELTAETIGIVTWQGQKQAIYPGCKRVMQPRDGDVVKILIQQADMFQKEREEYKTRQQELWTLEK